MNQLKPSVCIDAVFEGIAVDKAVKQVRAAGVTAFEFWGWWDRDLAVIEDARDQTGLEISACCTKFISLVDSTVRDQYLEGLGAIDTNC